MAVLDHHGVEHLISKIADKFASAGGAAYNEIHHSSTDNRCIIGPNTFHVWDEVEELNIFFTEKIEDKAHEFLFQFTSGSEPTTLTIYGDIKWANGEALVIEANKIYQISILKGLGSVMSWDL